ncbi:MAG: type II toxin-antitoxin system VapC family toxin [Acidobacteriota bacterium]|nr:type II toxin-antitoxin system VapC family toxin [Acidobacteriota bacterium]
MTSLIVDASVVAKRIVLEPDTDKAKVLFANWGRGALEICAPAILPAEIANMLWKRARRALLSAAAVEELYREFSAFHIPLWPIEDLAELSLALALKNGHSAYDGLYVALAIKTGWDLVTADERLYNTLSPSMPEIHLLRNYE